MDKPIINSFQPSNLPLELRGLAKTQEPLEAGNFREVFDRFSTDHKDPIRFSSNAQQKLERAGLNLSTADKARLGSGFKALEYKGVKDGLIVVDDKRFVVSVSNKTVITIMSSRDREVFTNIEGVAFE